MHCMLPKTGLDEEHFISFLSVLLLSFSYVQSKGELRRSTDMQKMDAKTSLAAFEYDSDPWQRLESFHLQPGSENIDYSKHFSDTKETKCMNERSSSPKESAEEKETICACLALKMLFVRQQCLVLYFSKCVR